MSAMAFEADAADVPPPLNLTVGAANAISMDRYPRTANGDIRVVMQVIGLARLKYSVPEYWDPLLDASLSDCRDDSRELFKKGKSIRYSDPGAKDWGGDTPYRLQLSDGEHSVVGKFHPENSWSKDYAVHSRIHQLVQEEILKEGTIISFQPHSHVESGSGMSSMFDLKVEGWSKVIGAPQPCHNGVPSFSPRDLHHCTVPAALSHDEHTHPIDWPAALLAKTIQETCGHCAVSGSAALAEYLDSLPGCQHCYGRCYGQAICELCAKGDFSNDVDIFVPEWPEAVTHYKSQGVKLSAGHGPRFDANRLEDEILPKLFKDYRIRHTKVTTTAVRLSKLDDMHPYANVDAEQLVTNDYGWMRIFVGLKFKHEFYLVSSNGQRLPKPIQIMVLDAFPHSPEESWGEMVTKSFDADVIKCLAHIDPECEKGVGSITFNEGALKNLMAGRFGYTMRPCHSFPQMLKRLTKYKERGFELQKFSFDARVSKEWREHILLQFQLKYANTWVSEWVDALGFELPTDVLDMNIMPFLECRPEERLQEEARGMLRRNILAELERTNGYDPGHNQIDRNDLLDMWCRIDRKRNGEGDDSD